MKQYEQMVHRDIFSPIYELTPPHLKTQLLKKMGFENALTNFGKRVLITVPQFEIMKTFKDRFELMSKNIVGLPVNFDFSQVNKTNNGYIKLITSDDFKISDKTDTVNGYTQLERTKIVNEQIRVQKQLNEYKRLIAIQ